MASIHQELRVIKHKNKKPRTTIHLQKRTGYQNVTINGKHYYYNANKTFSKAKDVSFEKIIKDNSKYEPLKQKIIVRRTKADYATI